MINLIFAVVGTLLAFYLGVLYTESKYEKVLREMIVSLKNEKNKSDAAWEKHCKALREQYQKALMEKNNAPTADGAEVKHGKWVKVSWGDFDACSECGCSVEYELFKKRYCPNCGAKMDGERKEK